jgi:nucleoside-diphosphate-sugar epimerase
LIAVVSGGAGFIGSHLCELLVGRGWKVIAIDNFLTGRRSNIAALERSDSFEIVEADVSKPLPEQVLDSPADVVFHLASPASPGKSPYSYMSLPFETLRAGSCGTWTLLDYAKARRAVFVLASTSEVYGDPEVSPQPESYWGNVNPVGPRAVYDEAKRFAEALSSAYAREFGLDVKIARIFNTYGPKMRPDDGRVVSNMVVQALTGRPLTVYGDGSQTRSFCYIDDMVKGLVRLAESDLNGPCNLGNPSEFRIIELAELVRQLVPDAPEITYEPLPPDDPKQRRPDISLAKERLGWEPKVPLAEGLKKTIEWYKTELALG